MRRVAKKFVPDSSQSRRLAELIAAPTSECIHWPGTPDRSGYGRTHWRGAIWGAHVVALYLTQGGPPKPDLQCAHSCAVRSCVNPRHLRWATHAENEMDKLAHGNIPRGEQTKQHKISNADVAEMRAAHERGEGSISSLARAAGISRGQASRIIRNEQRKAG